MKFRCYAYTTGDRWHGICTDLDIAIDGHSYEEIKASLETCIEMHLESIVELPEEERRRFLARSAPWRIRAWLASSTWVHQLLQGTSAHSTRSFFLEAHVAPSQISSS